MRIILKGTHIELTDDIRDLVEEKIGSLSRFLEDLDPASVEARVEVGIPSEHLVSRTIHRAEVNLTLPGTLLRAETENPGLSAALTEVGDELERQVERYRETKLLAGHIGGKGTPPRREDRHAGACGAAARAAVSFNCMRH